MTETLTTTAEREVRKAVANMQQPGVETSLSTSNGATVTLEDPRRVVEDLCEIAQEPDPGTDPWPYEGEDPVEFLPADNAQAIGEALIRRLRRFDHLHAYRIHYLFRNKKWESKGKTVHGKMQRPTGLLKNYAEADFIVLLNWESWQACNPMQRVALVYHELRHGDAEGKTQGHDFEGFFDELELFGTGTYRDWNRLASAADNGTGVRHQYTLSLLDQE